MAPVVALLLLAPVIGEVLFGATRITTLFVLIPQIGTWGCAALIIRDVARRHQRNRYCVLLLGIALAVAEECLIQQTSLAPLVGADPKHPYGRAFGVNWIYLLWALGYESIWVVVLPIELTELIFPDRRDEPWLGARGLAISAGAFLVASFVAWYSWTQVFVPRFFPEPAYRVPIGSIVVASAVIILLVVAALGLQRTAQSESETTGTVPRSWLVGLVGFVLGLPWFALVFLAYGAVPTLPAPIPMIAGLAWAGVAFALIDRWSRRPTWQDPSRLALLSGGLVASMLAGFVVLKLGGAPPIDIIGKLCLNVIAVLALMLLARRIRSRMSTT
jgi:hypothetical protein